jgi:hypothetical protein
MAVELVFQGHVDDMLAMEDDENRFNEETLYSKNVANHGLDASVSNSNLFSILNGKSNEKTEALLKLWKSRAHRVFRLFKQFSPVFLFYMAGVLFCEYIHGTCSYTVAYYFLFLLIVVYFCFVCITYYRRKCLVI